MRTIHYVIQAKSLDLYMKPLIDKGTYTLRGVSDSEYAGDRDSLLSVYGFIIYFNDSPISCKSKSGKGVTL
jgi:hypothetical protein